MRIPHEASVKAVPSARERKLKRPMLCHIVKRRLEGHASPSELLGVRSESSKR